MGQKTYLPQGNHKIERFFCKYVLFNQNYIMNNLERSMVE